MHFHNKSGRSDSPCVLRWQGWADTWGPSVWWFVRCIRDVQPTDLHSIQQKFTNHQMAVLSYSWYSKPYYLIIHFFTSFVALDVFMTSQKWFEKCKVHRVKTLQSVAYPLHEMQISDRTPSASWCKTKFILWNSTA